MVCLKRTIFFELVAAAVFGSSVGAQPTAQASPDWPHWAYGFLSPLAPGDRLAPPCPETARPTECRYPPPVVQDDGTRHGLPDTDLSFTRNEAHYDYGPADWYPGDHPRMPDIVAHGRESAGIRACALCHYPNGQGKTENAHVAGLPAAYILQQLDAFANGDRLSSDPRKVNTNEMAAIARGLTDTEKREVAEYYASIDLQQFIRVIESEEAPQVRPNSAGLMIPVPAASAIELGQRIIEVPEHPERTELQRDPRGGFVAYVPEGSLSKGEALVTTGAGKTIQCTVCHGQGLRGLGDIPGIAGRTASYTMRQLWDFKQGTRVSQIMVPVVQSLSVEDMLNISAYLASQTPYPAAHSTTSSTIE